MSDRPLNQMSDAELAEEHTEMARRSNNPNTPHADWMRASKRCDDCENEIERRRKGKEWAASYFGPKRYNKGGHHPPETTE